MVKEFAYLGVIHSDPSWESTKAALKPILKPGQIVAYEISPKGMQELQPYLDLIKKAKQKKTTPEEEARLKRFFAAAKQTPDIAFSAKLVYMLQQMGCSVVPLGSSAAKSAEKRINALITQAQKRKDKKEVERLIQRKEDLIAVKEYSAFRKKVVNSSPDVVIVGAKHHGAFSGLPHKVVMDQMPLARVLLGRKLDASMHRRAQARSRMAQKRVNRLLDRKGFAKAKRK
jgi:hypothetical protein